MFVRHSFILDIFVVYNPCMLKTVEMIRTSKLCADIPNILCESHEVYKQMETPKLGIFTAALSATGQTPVFAPGTAGRYEPSGQSIRSDSRIVCRSDASQFKGVEGLI